MHSQKSLPNLKRKQKVLPLHERVALEKVLGFTVSNSCGLATDPNTGQIAYPAGCVVVLYNPRRNKQTHLVNTSKKAITCLAFSKDGRYLATGECGHQPSVRLWDLEEMTQIAEFQGHKFGINAVIFSPNQKNLISVGSQYDMMVNVWNWRTQCKVASNKVAAKVTGIAFSEDSSTFVTVGNRHVKFWNMDSSKSRIKETVPLKGHSGILGEQKNNFFCGVCCGCGATANKTYAITRSGLLCEFNDNRLLDKWVELRTTSATCIVSQEHHVFVGCANGIVRVFSADSLHYVTTLPRPHHLGVDVASGQDPNSVTAAPADAVYPDTVALSIDDEACKLTCIYNDHSLYIWDIHDIKRIGKCRSFLYHSSAIWGLEVYPPLEQGVGLLPRGSFFTCSSDDTIRIWNVEPHMSTDTAYKHNIYSNELLKVIYTDPDLCNIVEKEFNPAGKTDKTDTQYQDTHGVRSLSVSHDGKHLASGDRVGNIRIHELEYMEELHMLEAHDSEVLSLEYSEPALGKNILASTSRDRLIHIFDSDNDYELLQTLDDHSAAITSVKFYENEHHQLGMLSCGMDKSLLFRGAQMEPEFQFVMTRHLVGKTTLYDMCLDPRQKFVATACQDRNIRIYNLKNGKYKKSYSGSTGTDGTLLRLAQDRSGAFVVASCSDKNVGIFDFFTGECMANMLGHSEVVTGIRFTNDMKHVISVSGDGCIFIWRLPYDMTEQMCKRLMETTGSVTNANLTTSNGTYLNEDDFIPATTVIENVLATADKNANLLTDPGSQYKPDFRFSVGQLPSWAKREVLQDTRNIQTTKENPAVTAPSGRWAQRAVVKTLLPEGGNTEGTTNFPLGSLPSNQTDNSNYQVETIIVGEECEDDDDEDDEDFGPNKTFVQNKVPFGQTMPLEDEDDDDDSIPPEDVVFFPSKDEEEGSETTAKSYRVFEGDIMSVAESDGTEQSVDSDDDEASKAGDSSLPSTPDMDHFMLNQFTLKEAGEEKFDQVIPDVPQPHTESSTRLSMSTRFLSLSQQKNLRHGQKTQAPTIQDRKEMMAQAVMETRRRLQAVPRDSKGKPSGRDPVTKDTSYTGGKEQLLLSPGGGTLDRSRWQKRAQSPSLAANVHRWNSMFDVASRSQSPGRKSDGASTAYRRNRSRTPIILATTRRSTSPRLQPDRPGLHVTTSLTRSHSQHEVCRDGAESTSTDGSGDSTFIQSSSDVTSSGVGDKGKAGGKKEHSYQSATKSSKAKSRFSAGSNKDSVGAGVTSNRRSLGLKIFSAGLKNKFKSTPDLMTINDAANKENSGFSTSKTTEDLRDQGSVQEKDDLQDAQKQHSWKNPLLSAVATSGQGSASPTPSSSSGYMSATSSITSKVGMTLPSAVPGASTSPASGSEKVSVSSSDAKIMPPPPTTNVISSRQAKSVNRRSTMSDLTLQQAKQILLGHPVTSDSSSSNTSSSSARRRSTANEGTPSMLGKQRPHSALSTMLKTTTSSTTTGSTRLSTQTSNKPLSTTISTSSFHVMLGSASAASTVAMNAATSTTTSSAAVGCDDYLDELPEKDTDASVKLHDKSPSSQNTEDCGYLESIHTSPISPPDVASTPHSSGYQPKWSAKSKLDMKSGGKQDAASHAWPTSENNTVVSIAKSSNVIFAKPSTSQEAAVGEPRDGSDQAGVESVKQGADFAAPKSVDSSTVGVTRHRDPLAYNRSRVSPARQVSSAGGTSLGHGMLTTIRPPSIPAPLVPPRELASHSPQRPSVHMTGDQTSSTKDGSTLGHDVVVTQWQRAQQNRDRQQVMMPARSVNQVVTPQARTSTVGEEEPSETTAGMPKANGINLDTDTSQPHPDESADDPDQEVKRPDKTRSSPPASLIADVTKSVNQSCVILTPPTTLQAGAADANCKDVVGDFKLALDRILAAYSTASQEAGSCKDRDDVKLLRETLQQAQSDLSKVLGPSHPDFTPYLSQKDQTATPSSTSAAEGTSCVQLPVNSTNTEILNMLDYYSVHLCELFRQKLTKDEDNHE